MCGVTGLWCDRGVPIESLRSAVEAMTDSIRHRGPDDRGTWVEANDGVALGHRRLSIVDLSPEGHQPMWSASRRYATVFNGEIYNYERIRQELVALGRAPNFRGHSDTEVMLAAFEAWGITAALQRFVGMFALALWDTHERTLILARDRLGIKPLYYGSTAPGVLTFGSELTPLTLSPGFEKRIDPNAVASLLRVGRIVAPRSVYRGVSKCSPGTYVVFRSPRDSGTVHTFWSAAEVAAAGLADPLQLDARDAADMLLEVLRDSVALRMIADVPLGAFLSGGIDSSLVVALMQERSSRAVRTFSIGFEEAGYDEAPHARAVAAHLKTDHTELYVSAEDALAVVPRLPRMFDEPFSDSSQIPTFLVSELARRSVTVALSGDGGDELFGGYRQYLRAPQLQLLTRTPTIVRRAARRAATAMARTEALALLARASRVLPPAARRRLHPWTLRRGLSMLSRESAAAIYEDLGVHWSETVVPGADDVVPRGDRIGGAPFLRVMMLNDLTSYLPDDILTKVDRASMAVALEARVPLLDHRVVELSWRFPPALLMQDGEGKLPLRNLLARYVPRELFERPKMGFGIPVGAWLRGPLRGWAEALLATDALAADGLLDPLPIRALWREHLSGEMDWSYHLWDVLMLQAWREEARVSRAT